MATETVYGGGAQISTNMDGVAALDDLAAGIDADAVDSVGTVTTKTGLTVVEKGDGAVHKTVLTLDEVDVTITDGTTPGTDACFGSQSLYTFPEGHIVILGGHQLYPTGDLEATDGDGPAGATGLSATATLEVGVGTTARGDTTDFALESVATDQNIAPVQAGVVLATKLSDADESSQLAASVWLDGSAGAVVAYFNVCGATGDTDCGTAGDVLKVSGTITIVWTTQGDD